MGKFESQIIPAFLNSSGVLQALRQSPVGIILLDSEGMIQWVNPAFLHIVQLDEDLLLNQPIYQYLHLEDVETARERIQSCFSQHKGPLDIRLHAMGAVDPWVNLSLTPLETADDQPVLLMGSISHIPLPQHQRAGNEHPGEALLGWNREYEALFEQSPYGIALLNQDRKFVRVNRKACEIFGYSKEEFYEHYTHELHPDEDEIKSRASEILKEVMESGNGTMDTLFLTKTNRVIHGKVSMSLLDIGGTPYIQAIFEDISDQKEQEEHLRKSRMELEALYMQSPYGILIVSSNRYIKRINPRVVEMLGYSEEELMRMKVFDLHPDDQVQVPRIEASIAQLRPGENQVVNAVFKAKSGNLVEGELSISLLEIDGEMHILGICADITEFKETSRRLVESEAKIHSIVNAVDARIIHLDQDGVITYSNRKEGRYVKGDFIGEKLVSFIWPEEEQTRTQEYLEICRESQAPVVYMGLSSYEDGSPKHIMVKFNPIISEEKVTGFTVLVNDVTPIKEKEGILSSIFNSIEARIWLLDEQYNIKYVNHLGDGIKPSQVVGKNFLGIQQGTKRREDYATLFETCQNEKRTVEYKTRLEYPDGKVRDSLVHITPVISEGIVMGYTIIRNDFSRIQKAIDDLQRSESRLRSIVESSDTRITMVSTDDRVLYSNTTESGQHAVDQTGKDFKHYLGPNKWEEFQAQKKEVVRSRQALNYEVESFDENGNKLYYFVILSPILKGEEVLGLTYISRDITEMKELQIEHLETLEVVKAAIEATGFGVYEWDIANNKPIMWDDNVHRIFGLEPGEYSGKIEEFYEKYVPAEDVQELSSEIEESIATKGHADVIHRIKRKDGEIRWVHTRRMITPDAEGNPAHLKGVIWDITAEKEQEEMKIRARALEAQNQELKEFTYIASHDLQSPLRTISNFSDLLEEDCYDEIGEEGRYYIGAIKEGVGRMRALIMDLLDYSRIGKEAERELTDLNQLLADTIHDLHQAITESGAVITVGELPQIQVFKVAMRLLFQNLIGNAIKFQPHDSIPKIEVGVKEKPGEWHFYVQDNGLGIDPKNHEKIFQVFQRLAISNTYEGTGIGLAHCAKVAKLHDGKIWVESELGNGSRFWVSIPKSQAF